MRDHVVLTKLDGGKVSLNSDVIEFARESESSNGVKKTALYFHLPGSLEDGKMPIPDLLVQETIGKIRELSQETKKGDEDSHSYHPRRRIQRRTITRPFLRYSITANNPELKEPIEFEMRETPENESMIDKLAADVLKRTYEICRAYTQQPGNLDEVVAAAIKAAQLAAVAEERLKEN